MHAAPSATNAPWHKARRHLRVSAAVLVVLSTLLQALALLGVLPLNNRASQLAFGSVEMVLIVLLAANAWRTQRWLRTHSSSPRIRSTATLCAVSLSICVLGDLVNRNYFDQQFARDTVIRHSYLADSVWFFLPGYALVIVAVWRIARTVIGVAPLLTSAFVAGLVGVLSDLGMRPAGTGAYVTAMTAAYSIPITIVGVSALWLLASMGWRRAALPALGLVLATAADALIGNFWLFRDGYFPAISHINWIVYFVSQAMIQQLPWALSDADAK